MHDHVLLHLVGAAYTGKSATCRYLAQRFRGTRVSPSEPFRKMLIAKGEPVNRQTLSDTAEVYRMEHGVNGVMELIVPAVQTASTPLVIVDGVRAPAMLSGFLDLYPRPYSLVIGVRADYEVRVQNAQKRGTKTTAVQIAHGDLQIAEHSVGPLLDLCDVIVENNDEKAFLENVARYVEAWIYTHITPLP